MANKTQTNNPAINTSRTRMYRTLDYITHYHNQQARENQEMINYLAQSLIEYSHDIIRPGHRTHKHEQTGKKEYQRMYTQAQDKPGPINITSRNLGTSILIFFKLTLGLYNEPESHLPNNQNVFTLTLQKGHTPVKYKKGKLLPWYNKDQSQQENLKNGRHYLETMLITTDTLRTLNETNKPVPHTMLETLFYTDLITTTHTKLQHITDKLAAPEDIRKIITSPEVSNMMTTLHLTHTKELYQLTLDAAVRSGQPTTTTDQLKTDLTNIKNRLNNTKQDDTLLNELDKTLHMEQNEALDIIIQSFKPPERSQTATTQQTIASHTSRRRSHPDHTDATQTKKPRQTPTLTKKATASNKKPRSHRIPTRSITPDATIEHNQKPIVKKPTTTKRQTPPEPNQEIEHTARENNTTEYQPIPELDPYIQQFMEELLWSTKTTEKKTTHPEEDTNKKTSQWTQFPEEQTLIEDTNKKTTTQWTQFQKNKPWLKTPTRRKTTQWT